MSQSRIAIEPSINEIEHNNNAIAVAAAALAAVDNDNKIGRESKISWRSFQWQQPMDRLMEARAVDLGPKQHHSFFALSNSNGN